MSEDTLPEELNSPEPAAESTEIAVEATDDPDTHRFECRACGFVYDPDEGVKKLAIEACLLYTSPSPRDVEESRMPSSA